MFNTFPSLTVASALAASLATFSLPAAGALADLRIVNRATGQALPTYTHQGRVYIAGAPGDRYSVEVTNKSGARIMTVISVDGVNIVTGETATQDQNGYVLSAYQSYQISGWRKSTNEVAAFYFTSLPDSYAARTDRPNHVGVIGVAVYREMQPPRPIRPAPGLDNSPRSSSAEESRDAASARADSAPGAAAAPSTPDAMRRAAPAEQRNEKIGTGHGERERSDVTFTDFRRATQRPSEVITLYYDSYANLVARGIVHAQPRIGGPNPFPGLRFVPDPRG